MHKPIKEHEGKKYLRTITSAVDDSTIEVDIYCIFEAFGVTSQPIGHAIKKLLAPGQRGKGSIEDDLIGAIAAINRAIDIERKRERKEMKTNGRSRKKPPKDKKSVVVDQVSVRFGS